MKKITLYILALASFAVMTGRVQAQATLADDTIVLGDQTVVSGHFDRLDGDGIELLRQTVDSVSGEQQAVITSFEPGLHWLHVSVDDSLSLVVTDVEVDTATAEIRDLAPIARVPYTFWEIFRWVLLAWAVAAVGVVVWWLVERKRRHGSIFVHHEPVDTRNPYERASEALEALREGRLWQAGKVKEYHTALTDIVRRFIEEAAGIRATDMTSDETVEAVEGRWPEVSGQLRDIFTTADLVKFAKSEPLPHEHEASMAKAVKVVVRIWERVKPQEEEVPHE